MKPQELDPIPPGDNPFDHDLTSMGTSIGSNIIIMHSNFSHEHCSSLVIVDRTTGRRYRLEPETVDVVDDCLCAGNYVMGEFDNGEFVPSSGLLKLSFTAHQYFDRYAREHLEKGNKAT